MSALTNRIPALLQRAGAQARSTGGPVLVSLVERVPAVDPLDALDAITRAGEGDHALALNTADRMYWSRQVDGLSLAGVGAAVTLTAEGPDRFDTVDRKWTALVRDALIDDPSGDDLGYSSGYESGYHPGASPALMGGFSFDPEGPRTSRWRGFPSTHLFVPRLQLALTGGNCWLTTTLLVGEDGQSDIELAVLVRMRACVLESRTPGATPRHPKVIPRSSQHVTYTDVPDPRDWSAMVGDAVTAIRDGEMEKVVLAREVRAVAACTIDVTETLRRLRSANSTCYVFGCWSGGSAFVGASPERLVRVDGREVQSSSLAGSVRRGATAGDDAAQAALLRASAKDRAEHAIVRRALCTALARLCDDVSADDEPALLSLPQVHHLHTAVRGRLRAGHTLLQLAAQLHPTPAVGGAPTDAALRFIREHEQMDRGWYAGPIGWLQRDRGELAVGLRSALIAGTEARLFAGCGVVADSDPDQEYAESVLKLGPMQLALETALAAGDTSAPAACSMTAK